MCVGDEGGRRRESARHAARGGKEPDAQRTKRWRMEVERRWSEAERERNPRMTPVVTTITAQVQSGSVFVRVRMRVAVIAASVSVVPVSPEYVRVVNTPGASAVRRSMSKRASASERKRASESECKRASERRSEGERRRPSASEEKRAVACLALFGTTLSGLCEGGRVGVSRRVGEEC